MKYTSKKLEHSQIKFECAASPEEFEKAVDRAYAETKKRYNIPGFRKGHAPKKVIESMYGGPSVFYQDATDILVDDGIKEIAANEKYEFIALSDVENVELTDKLGLNYTLVLAYMPEVKLGKYTGLNVKKDEVKVTEEDIDKYIEAERDKQARFADVDTAAEKGSFVLLDYVGTVDGVAFDGGSAENYELELGSNTFIPGFEDQLVGVKAGEFRDVKVTFPEDYHAENLAGKEAVFSCEVKAVRVRELPEVNNEFAKDVSEFDTLDDYRADIKKTLLAEAEHEAEHAYEHKLVEAVVDASTLDIPEVLVKREIDDMIGHMEESFKSQYAGLSFDVYLKYIGSTREQFAEEKKPEAEKNVRTRLVLEEIIKTENMTVEESEINDKIASLAEEKSMTLEEYKKKLKNEDYNYLANWIINEKLMKLLKSEGEGKKPRKKAAAETAEDAKSEEGEKPEKKKRTTKKSTKSEEVKADDAE